VTEEARDNSKFLRTAERHFRVIAIGQIHEIAGVLIPMFNALRLIWAISTYYSDDTRMGLLLQRIANEVADRAESSISQQVRTASELKTKRHPCLLLHGWNLLLLILSFRIRAYIGRECFMAQGLFRMPHDRALAQLSTAKGLLERWFSAYMEVLSWRPFMHASNV